MSNDFHDDHARVTRRQLFGTAGLGIGSVALASLLERDAHAATSTPPAAQGQAGLPGLPHHEPKAKRVVMLWQGGGPSDRKSTRLNSSHSSVSRMPSSA